MTAFAQGTTRPGTNSASFAANQTQTTGAVVALGPTGQIAVNVSQTATLYGDVTGYYAPPIQGNYSTDFGTGEPIFQTSARILSASRASQGTFDFRIDRPVAGCLVFGTTNEPGYTVNGYQLSTYIIQIQVLGRDERFGIFPVDSVFFNFQILC
ncbi:hypothetical protein [Hansschlegelia zhihuaiae]|uniref:Uncharacterized protein n=1 Tax=Hansschlegelia zhihuaiae TaxID=405005 RepID=A0A4Q0MP40_9HYPH|nr:hypothetical protein [Hansschlegelia zhihuaiae]RXF75608.1 hypothetical protein EK403_01845 [Hansschlegelia zhihuaiae]